MKFKVISSDNPVTKNERNVVRLFSRNWDDWFEFSTLFIVEYVDGDGEAIILGTVKIGKKGLKGGRIAEQDARRPNVPSSFSNLPDEFFSLGQSVDYYKNIDLLGYKFRTEFLKAFRDIAFDDQVYTEAINERVTKVSLLRDVSVSSVIGQFRRVALGNSELSRYFFQYYFPEDQNKFRLAINFKVEPQSNPPTNIHVIIGRNGVGKTHLLNNMINALLKDNSVNSKYGFFQSSKSNSVEKIFANLVSVTFSAFDETEPIAERKDKTAGLKYSYIGLKRVSKPGERLAPKSPTILRNEFVKSLELCLRLYKMDIWKKAVIMLESDPIFKASNVLGLSEQNPDDEAFKERCSKLFHNLSSGHKIVLLTVTKLVESIEEKSLVLLDEPEAHLHPPLLSAFIRVVSELLISRNGVAIVATHSPVLLQEVPRSCVRKLRRNGRNMSVDELQFESFGENVGVLTREVFGLEVTHAGFHKLLSEAVAKNDSFESIMEYFNNELGMEAQAIVRTMVMLKNRKA